MTEVRHRNELPCTAGSRAEHSRSQYSGCAATLQRWSRRHSHSSWEADVNPPVTGFSVRALARRLQQRVQSGRQQRGVQREEAGPHQRVDAPQQLQDGIGAVLLTLLLRLTDGGQ